MNTLIFDKNRIIEAIGMNPVRADVAEFGDRRDGERKSFFLSGEHHNLARFINAMGTKYQSIWFHDENGSAIMHVRDGKPLYHAYMDMDESFKKNYDNINHYLNNPTMLVDMTETVVVTEEELKAFINACSVGA